MRLPPNLEFSEVFHLLPQLPRWIHRLPAKAAVQAGTSEENLYVKRSPV